MRSILNQYPYLGLQEKGLTQNLEGECHGVNMNNIYSLSRFVCEKISTSLGGGMIWGHY